MLGLIGKKIGMMRVYDEIGEHIIVTVIQAGPCCVAQKKIIEKDGCCALQLSYEDIKEKKLNKPLKGHFSKNNLPFRKYLREFRIDAAEINNYQLGQELKLDNVFSAGQYLDIIGVSKGKGFAGVIKRHNFNRGPMSHGSCHHRATGSMGDVMACRVFKGKRIPGKMGNQQVTLQNLKVIKILSNENLVFIKGAVPGAKGSLVVLNSAIKKLANKKIS